MDDHAYEHENPSSDRSPFNLQVINIEELIRIIKDRLMATADMDWKAIITDIDGHWAEDIIVLLMRLDVIDGCFKPDQSITRAEFASLLVGIFQLEDIDAQIETFADLEQLGRRMRLRS